MHRISAETTEVFYLVSNSVVFADVYIQTYRHSQTNVISIGGVIEFLFL